MPVVITDHTNRVWAMEDPRDGLLHVGQVGKPGPPLEDVLLFVSTRQKQFEKFLSKRNKAQVKVNG